MYWYFVVLYKYAVFSGRARRKEFWWFFLIHGLIGGVLGVLALVNEAFGIIDLGYCLVTFLPMLGVYIRRFHDTGRSGWWVGIPVIPLVLVLLVCVPLFLEEKFDMAWAVFLIGGVGGMLVLLLISFVFLCQDSQTGMNQYGLSPKEEEYKGLDYSRYYQ